MPGRGEAGGGSFRDALERHGLRLARGETTTLQVNVGLRCDLACRHCHLEAGPDRAEAMGPETMDAVIACAGRLRFDTIDLTGGAPERVPGIERLVAGLAPLARRLIVRTNLTALHGAAGDRLLPLYLEARVALSASLPSVHPGQFESQRGIGTWEKCLAVLARLNGLGYGIPGSGLELDLVANPTGAFLPPGQEAAERSFRDALARKHGVRFSRLFTFANAPLGRFLAWLERTGNADGYRRMLAERFNPATVAGLMCRTILSVDWDGWIYDCDFHLAAGLPHGECRTHVSELARLPAAGSPIPVADHCFACAAGAGFT